MICCLKKQELEGISRGQGSILELSKVYFRLKLSDWCIQVKTDQSGRFNSLRRRTEVRNLCFHPVTHTHTRAYDVFLMWRRALLPLDSVFVFGILVGQSLVADMPWRSDEGMKALHRECVCVCVCWGSMRKQRSFVITVVDRKKSGEVVQMHVSKTPAWLESKLGCWNFQRNSC